MKAALFTRDITLNQFRIAKILLYLDAIAFGAQIVRDAIEIALFHSAVYDFC